MVREGFSTLPTYYHFPMLSRTYPLLSYSLCCHVPTHYLPTHHAPTPYIPHQAQPLLAHDLTELRRLSLLELAATHGDPAEAVPSL